MSVEVEYKVLLSKLDWESHAFLPDESGDTREAACGARVLVVALDDNGETVPGCMACALKLGAQVDQKRIERDHRIRERIVDDVALAAAAEVTSLISAAERLDGPAHASAIRALRRRSRTVRAWSRWHVLTSFFLPLGVILLGCGIWNVVSMTVSSWTGPLLIGGSNVLLVTVIGLERGNRRALQVALGLQLKVRLRGTEDQGGPDDVARP
ncbi:hypothetical protein C8D87_114173 [Lentzea atacamensis]|uniref:Uncharacterized protein n=1 Tax=Lentzea atacamensis TaxID=531938 RepID=A0ABX9DW92_9PSEU|nr:hypothetical protein [Lentzea atacamensis]RAS59561.1 hypothetical protein C8D87_114173 [Lentzea atacamensis]